MKPRVPPKMAPSSTKPANRAPTPRKRIGPRRAGRVKPTSTPSICQLLPSVAAKPTPSAVCPASGVDKAASTTNIPPMDRRTFVLLTGAASSGLVRPPDRLTARPPALGRLRFELDDHRNWSLWYRGAWVGNRLVTLADLEDTTVGGRQPPGGESILVRGHAAGVLFEAEFFSGEAGATPQASVALTIYPDRILPTVRGVRFFQTADVLPGDGDLIALVNGYHSWSA